VDVCVEICVTTADSAVAADRGGADEVELCTEIAVGGITPGEDLISAACDNLTIPTNVLIRPRAGDFVYTEKEFAAMRRDVTRVKALGASGVVIGLLRADGTVDRARVSALLEVAYPLYVTFHKAFDAARDPFEALEELVDLGVDRVLTSGRQPSAIEGLDLIATLVSQARGRIVVMAGGRIRAEHIRPIVADSHVPTVHVGSGACRGFEGEADVEQVSAIVFEARNAGSVPPSSRSVH
jgi:copper homeostasis protein